MALALFGTACAIVIVCGAAYILVLWDQSREVEEMIRTFADRAPQQVCSPDAAVLGAPDPTQDGQTPEPPSASRVFYA